MKGGIALEVNSFTIMLVGIGITVFALFSYAYWKDWQFKKMKPRPRTIMLNGIGATFLAMASHAYWTDWRFDKIELPWGGYMEHFHTYDEYYFKVEEGSRHFMECQQKSGQFTAFLMNVNN